MIERGHSGFGAYVPDLPGCVAAAATLDEVRRLIGEGIAFHLEGLRDMGEPVPVPASLVELVEVA